jgi:ammonia channel protein AmtB
MPQIGHLLQFPFGSDFAARTERLITGVFLARRSFSRAFLKVN